MKTKLKKLICKLIGHKKIYVMTGIQSFDGDGNTRSKFNDDEIELKCKRCGFIRKATEMESQKALKIFIRQTTKLDV